MNKINLVNALYIKAKQNTFNENDFTLLTNEFYTKEIETLPIKKYSQNDSKNILFTLIKSTAIKIYSIISYNDKFKITEPIIVELFNSLFLDFIFESSDCYLEYCNLKQEMIKNVLNILKRLNTLNIAKDNIISDDANYKYKNMTDNHTDPLCCINDKINSYLQSKEECEVIGINLSLLTKTVKNIRNTKLKILNSKKMDDKFLLIICEIKNEIVNENIKDIFSICRSLLMNHKGSISIDKERKYLFCMAIISEINTIIKEKDLNLIDILPEEISEPYLGYIHSLMVDDESIEKVWEMLLTNGFVNDMFENLKDVYSQLHITNTYSNDTYKNETYNNELYNILKYSIKILTNVASNYKESHTFFIRNFDDILNLLWTELPYKILGDFFNFVSHLLYDEEIKNRVYDYFVLTQAFYERNTKSYMKTGGFYFNDEKSDNEHFLCNKKNIYEIFEDELKRESFELTEGLINFFVKLKPEKIFENERNEFFNCAIKSCNLKILSIVLENIEIKKLFEKENMLKAIKRGIEKDDRICDLFISFILRNVAYKNNDIAYNVSNEYGCHKNLKNNQYTYEKTTDYIDDKISYKNESIGETCNLSIMDDLLYLISQDVVLLNLIVRSKSRLFFSFISLFHSNCFVLFLNDDFLERINENVKLGLKYLGSVCNTNDEYCKFVIENKKYFNDITSSTGFYTNECNITNNSACFNDSNTIEFYLLRMYDAISKRFIEEFDTENEKLVVKRSEIHYFYEILTRLIVHKYEKGENIRKYVIKDYKYNNENITSYCNYLKALLAIEENVDNEIKYLLNLEIENESIGELIGYYKSVRNDCKFEYKFECKKLENIILNRIQNKNNNESKKNYSGKNYGNTRDSEETKYYTQNDTLNLFVKHFRKASKYEKFLLFLILDTEKLNKNEKYNKKVYNCIFEEIKEMVNNDVSDKQDVLIMEQCLSTLLYMKNLDDVIKFLKNQKLSSYFNDLLIKLCIKNIINYGKEVFDMSILENCSVDLQVKCCFFSYGFKAMKDKVIKKWVENLRKK